MAKLTDEMLMAYADGQLNALARAKVEAVLPGDQDARRRLGVFRATGAPLAQLYAGPMAEPVPAHLKDFVLNYRAPAAPAKKASLAKGRLAKALAGSLDKARRAGESFGAWLAQPMPQTARWRLAAAPAAMLALGAGAGFFLHGGATPDSLVAFEGGRILASGALRHVLETQPSGQEARIGGVRGEAVSMRATLTFKSKDDSYCREYEIATPGAGGFAGLGCRGRDGDWALQVHAGTMVSAKDGSRPAAHTPPVALDEIVDRMIEGDAFGKKQEAEAIASGWK